MAEQVFRVKSNVAVTTPQANTTVDAALFTGTANNSTYLDGKGADYYDPVAFAIALG